VLFSSVPMIKYRMASNITQENNALIR
jgi:hypothetical protein